MSAMSGVYCFGSAKGGSGKTILAATFGTLLAGLGKRCLLIDADGSTNGMTLLFLERVVEARNVLGDEAGSATGLFDAAAAGPLHVPLSDHLSFVPATYVLHDTQGTDPELFGERLAATLAQARSEFDFIIVDAQAGVDAFAVHAMRQADQVVIVSEYDPISAKGVERLKGLLARTISVEDTWVLFNKVLPEFTKSLGDFLVVSRYLPPVPWSADVVRAYVRGRLALDMDRGNLFTLGMLDTAGVLFGPEVADLAERWKESKDEAVRAPVRDKLESVKQELEDTERARFRIEYETHHRTRSTQRLAYTGVFVLLLFLSAWQLADLYTGFGIAPGVVDTVRRLLPAVATAFLAGVVALYVPRKRREDRERRELAEQSAELGRRIRNLETERQQLEAYASSSLGEVFRAGSDRTAGPKLGHVTSRPG